MYIIVLIIFTFIFVYSLTFRLFLQNPIKFIIYLFRDFYNNQKKYKHIPKKPFINCYVGLFGQGKTLSAVHDVVDYYKTYNGKLVYDDRFHKFLKQEVLILSNVDLKSVPYKKLVNLQQLVEISKYRHILDACKQKRTITVALIDEASVQLNNRNFRNNFNPETLRMLLTSRHSLIMGFYLTSQRFAHMDALLRQVTHNVIECSKFWRVVKNTYYDAWDYENSFKPTDCVPLAVYGYMAMDEDFKAYDTLAVVDELVKAAEKGDMLSDQEQRDAIGSKMVIVSGDTNKKKKRKRK